MTQESRCLGDAPISIVAAAQGIGECVARQDEIDRETMGKEKCAYVESEVAEVYDRQDMLVQTICFTRCKTLTEAAIQLAILGQMNELLCTSIFEDGEKENMLRQSRRLHFSVHAFLASEGAAMPDMFRENYLGEHVNPWISRDEALSIIRSRDQSHNPEQAQDDAQKAAA